MPLPFLLGGLFGAWPAVAWLGSRKRPVYFPQPLRRLFVGFIGAMIGTTVTPDIVSLVPVLVGSLVAMALFVPLAHASGYLVSRYLGGLDKGTALFAAMPGGMVEAVALNFDSASC